MKRWPSIAGLLMVCLLPALAFAAPEGGHLAQARVDSAQMGPLVRTLAGLSLLSFIPAALIAMTSFTRIIVTLSFLRHALGMPETPPNIVLITLALFLTFFTMQPVLEQSHRDGVGPFLDGRIGVQQAMDRGISPLRAFMQRHVRQEDLAAVAEMGRVELPAAGTAAEVPLRVLVPAFMLSELRAAFTAGFVIFLPFLLIDLVVAAVLMALGMMMVPPVSISLPMKVLLFVLIDGWTLLMRAIAGAYA